MVLELSDLYKIPLGLESDEWMIMKICYFDMGVGVKGFLGRSET